MSGFASKKPWRESGLSCDTWIGPFGATSEAARPPTPPNPGNDGLCPQPPSPSCDRIQCFSSTFKASRPAHKLMTLLSSFAPRGSSRSLPTYLLSSPSGLRSSGCQGPDMRLLLTPDPRFHEHLNLPLLPRPGTGLPGPVLSNPTT